MKKHTLCLIILAALTLLVALAGCGRRQEILNQIESEKVAESIAEESGIIQMDTRPRETVAVVPDTVPPETNALDETSDPDETTAPAETREPSETGGVPDTDFGFTPSTPPDPNDPYPNNEGYRLTGGIKESDRGYYEGVSADELKKRYASTGFIYDGSGTPMINTPTGVVFSAYGTNTFYHKLTGNMSKSCPDPLCRHSDCTWGKLAEILYISEDHIYFLARNRQEYDLFRSDLERNHVELLKENYPLYNRPIKYVRDDVLYIQEMQYREGQAATNRFVAWNLKTDETTVLSGGISDLEILGISGDTVFYRAGALETAPVYKTDLSFSHSEEILQDVDAVQVYQYNETYLVVLGLGDSGFSYAPAFVYNVKNGKQIDIRGASDPNTLYLDGHYVYYLKNITEEEIQVSVLKDYYQYVVQNPMQNFPYRCRNMDAGRIFRMDLETGREELVMELSYNGVPVRIANFIVDGKAVYVSYWTYKDYNNYYNQDYRDENGFITQTEDARYLLFDMSNGTVKLFDPYLK